MRDIFRLAIFRVCLLSFCMTVSAHLEEGSTHSAEEIDSFDCERVDIPHPELDYPLNFLRKYLIGSFTTLFHPFVSEADQRYLDALTCLTREDVQGAVDLLEQVIETEPTYSYAYIQLGVIYLWQDQLDLSYQMFQKVSGLCPCNEYLNAAMEKLALQWDKRGVRGGDSVGIYRTLVKCVPDSVAYQFGLGRALVHTGDLNEAEEVLKKCMEASPDDSDIGLQLADVYVLQQEYDKALALYALYPDRIEALEGQARIAMRESDFVNAQIYYEKLLEKNPHDLIARRNLARMQAIDLEFTKAKASYSDLLARDPKLLSGWQEFYEVRLHVDPTFDYNISYVEAKENDPDLKEPVVRDYYFDTSVLGFFPITDRWRVDVKGFFGVQKEKNIYATTPSINYDAYLSGAGLLSHVVFATNWKWDLFGHVKTAWNVGENIFPFQATTRIEPGTYLSYQSDRQQLVLGGNVDSYVIKNFAKGVSQLLTLRSLDATYRYTIPMPCQPELEGVFQETYFIAVPHNRRDTESGTIRIRVPYTQDYMKLFYTYEHRHFNKLNINYYSFSQQWRNTAGLSLFFNSLERGMSFDLTYWYRAQQTKNLYQPIGDFIYITPMQFLNCNQIQANWSIHKKDNLKVDFAAGYYRDGLPYRAWNLSGRLYWIF